MNFVIDVISCNIAVLFYFIFVPDRLCRRWRRLWCHSAGFSQRPLYFDWLLPLWRFCAGARQMVMMFSVCPDCWEFRIGTSTEAAAPVLAYSLRGGQIAALSLSVLCFGLIKNKQIKVEHLTVGWKSVE